MTYTSKQTNAAESKTHTATTVAERLLVHLPLELVEFALRLC